MKKYFKKNLPLIIIYLSLFSLFLALFIPTAVVLVKQDYAENHYEVTTKAHKEGTKSWIDYGNVSVGCGEMTCKFCEGRIIHSGHASYTIDNDEFIYYSTLQKVQITMSIFQWVFLIAGFIVFCVTLSRIDIEKSGKTKEHKEKQSLIFREIANTYDCDEKGAIANNIYIVLKKTNKLNEFLFQESKEERKKLYMSAKEEYFKSKSKE